VLNPSQRNASFESSAVSFKRMLGTRGTIQALLNGAKRTLEVATEPPIGREMAHLDPALEGWKPIKCIDPESFDCASP